MLKPEDFVFPCIVLVLKASHRNSAQRRLWLEHVELPTDRNCMKQRWIILSTSKQVTLLDNSYVLSHGYMVSSPQKRCLIIASWGFVLIPGCRWWKWWVPGLLTSLPSPLWCLGWGAKGMAKNCCFKMIWTCSNMFKWYKYVYKPNYNKLGKGKENDLHKDPVVLDPLTLGEHRWLLEVHLPWSLWIWRKKWRCGPAPWGAGVDPTTGRACFLGPA